MSDPQWTPAIPLVPDRPDDGHKGTFGTVIVVGGSTLMPGAPVLCATAALRAGTGLVKLAAEEALLPTLIAMQPGATGMRLDTLKDVEVKRGTVLAVGPGLGSGAAQRELVRGALESRHRMVLDADGLNTLAELQVEGKIDGVLPRDAEWVATPHPGEYKKLAAAFGVDGDPIDPANRPAAAAALAQKLGVVVLLKGQHTVVTDGRRIHRNPTGNPALATAGCGDVLTGLVASLMGQGMDAFNAAVLGAFLHGDAADHWAAQHGTSGLLAMELAHALPDAMRRRRGGASQATRLIEIKNPPGTPSGSAGP